MHAVTVLQKCLADVFDAMHAARRRVLLGAVAALLLSRRLILIELARAWPGAERVRAPLKRLDRLLGNRHLQAEIAPLYAAMARWVIAGTAQPVIIVDWSDVKADGRWHLLRAGVPVGGRTVTLFEAIYPEREKNAPRVERAFLGRLQALLPAGVKPIVVTDAGFRTPWFRSVAALGWDYVGRLRNRTLVRLSPRGPWVANRTLHTTATARAQRLRDAWISQKTPWACDLVLVKRARRRGRTHQRHYRKAEAANREPWLLATSLTRLPARAIVALYAKRMQIEQSFRDLKCDRYGCAFYYSLSRTADRLAVLLLLQALATFLAWLSALAKAPESDRATTRRRAYSLLRLGWEQLRRRTRDLRAHDLYAAFMHPPPSWGARLAAPR